MRSISSSQVARRTTGAFRTYLLYTLKTPESHAYGSLMSNPRLCTTCHCNVLVIKIWFLTLILIFTELLIVDVAKCQSHRQAEPFDYTIVFVNARILTSPRPRHYIHKDATNKFLKITYWPKTQGRRLSIDPSGWRNYLCLLGLGMV